VEENVSTRISGAGSNFLFSRPDGQGNGDRGMMNQIPLSPFPCLFHASESGVFLASKAEGLFFRSSSSVRCAGKTDVFCYELEVSVALDVEENVSTRISGAGSNFLFSKPDGQGNGGQRNDVSDSSVPIPLSFSCK
jgi:hypothetical protein